MATNVCGTGTGIFIHPDDPDLNNSVLIAKPAFGGIDLSWTYPEHNTHAVSHTLVYRSENDDPINSVRISIINGTTYYDRIENGPKTYYYWIRFVSINGTNGDLVGPAAATSRSTIEETLESLTGRIDSGMLALSLKGIIGGISENEAALGSEVNSRIQANGDLSLAFSDLQVNVNNVQTMVYDSVQELKSDQFSIVNSIDLMFAQLGETNALILEEKTVRTTEDQSLAQYVTTLESNLGDNIAQVQTNLQTNINKVGNIEAKYTTVLNVNGLIGGFGIGNDGETVTAGFDVDRFFVGRTNENKIKPFIIENDEVFINQAAINKLTINKLRSEDGSLAFIPATFNSAGQVLTPGKLKAALIDADSLELDYANIKNVDIDTADIRHGAIETAQLGEASVDTLQIKGNAVTVPVTNTGTEVQGRGPMWLEQGQVTFYLDQPGEVLIWWNFKHRYVGSNQVWGLYIEDSREGNLLERHNMSVANDFPSGAVSSYFRKGFHTLTLYWEGGNGMMCTGTVIAMGAMR